MTTVSIIIPVYKVQDYIERCLDSVINQTYSGRIECIIVDDCGGDGSIDIAERCIAENSSAVEFKIIRHEKNRGLAAARNTGVKSATGDFIMHLDSDDWLEPGAVDILVKKQNESDADIVSGNAMAHYNDTTKIFIEPDYADNMAMVNTTIKLTLDHVIWRRLIRRNLYIDNCIEAVEGVNIGEDHHTLPRLAYFAKKIVKVDTIVYHYNCMNPNSYMWGSKAKFNFSGHKNNLQSIAILKEFFSDKNRELVDKLETIELAYRNYNSEIAIVKGDKESYYLLCVDQSPTIRYYTNRIKYLVILRLSQIKHKILKS